jgi:carboxypeptidase Taq
MNTPENQNRDVATQSAESVDPNQDAVLHGGQLTAGDATIKSEMLKLKLESIYSRLEEAMQLSNIQELLSWDQNVYLPTGGAEWRGKQIALVSKLLHEKLTHPEFVEAVNAVYDRRAELSADDSANIREIKRDLDRQVKLPSDFVAEQARAHSEAQSAWEQARPKNDFQAVLPHLEKVFDLARREAAYLGYAAHPYDALLDKYEPGATIATIKPLLVSLGASLATLIPKIEPQFAGVPAPQGNYSLEQQQALGHAIAEALGYDFTRGRLDTTAHPFMTSLGPDDKRITTRYHLNNYLSALYGTMHEAGHAIYEQGLVRSAAAVPLGQTTSLGIHESQSRLWENLIGKSRQFAEYLHGLLATHMPEEAARTTPESLWKQINRVTPSLIRIEADEVTYSQHIIIRTLLEEELISGALQVKDLPARWNEMYKQYLGVEPPTNKDGVMQDVHWYCGLVGYFPTYALGNLYGASMMEKARQDIPNLDQLVEKGDFKPLKEWLNRNVHEHGRRYTAEELITHITGSGLSSEPFLKYIQNKFGV